MIQKYSIPLLVVFTLITFCSRAQVSEKGFPKSMIRNLSADAPVHYYSLPDFEAIWQKEAASKDPTAMLQTMPGYAGAYVSMDISFPASGRFFVTEDDQLIWQVKIEVPEAPAIGLYYDRFYLPSGVQLYLSNKTQTQILGAYSAANNSLKDSLFATEAVQGDEVILEFNISPGVNLSEIQLHINKGLVYFNGIRHLEKYSDLSTTAFIPVDGEADPYGWLAGRSSRCMLNAQCAPGVPDEAVQKSTVQLILPGPNGAAAVLCGATLLNNTANDSANCTNYLLTASHCEASGGIAGSLFSQYLIRFNFAYTDCEGDSVSEVQTLTGADIVARSPWPQREVREGMPDFMLLKLREGIPASWGAYLSGWDRNPNMPLSLGDDEEYTIYHHPSGDVRKVTYGRKMMDIPNAWIFSYPGDGSQGGIAPGSSGSGLFNAENYLIGLTSLGGHPEAICQSTLSNRPAKFNSYASYFKFDAAWEWQADPHRQLKHWLDPAATGATRLSGRSACANASSPVQVETKPDHSGNITVFPNPSRDGIFNVHFQLSNSSEIYAEVYALSGKRIAAYQLSSSLSGSSVLNLRDLAKGMYLVRFYFDGRSFSKKLMIR